MQPNRATAPNFNIIIPTLPTNDGMSSAKNVMLSIYETVLPGFDIPAIDVDWCGVVSRRDSSQGFSFNPWTFSFVVDSHFENWRTLYDWCNWSCNTGPLPKDHYVTSILIITDNYKNTIMRVKFSESWLRNLGDVTLNYREGEVQLECTATMEYGRYDIMENNEIFNLPV
jgi:hypothetical protein